jgi:hypothetical protein
MDEKPTFNVAIIYEDSATGRRAKHFYDKVIRELVDECNFSLELPGTRNSGDWKFGRACRCPSRLRHSFNARQSRASCPD